MFSSKRARKGNDTACVFVHAGAGFHSVTNETSHLQACNDAARAGMLVLRNGGSAVDAVEMAVKVLEDREITNAGYGSNLAVDGVVECDAVVVDHFGRSGGAGAVAQIRNPVSLARLVLDHTSRSLSLRRVAPNLLVGQGATDFAYEHAMPVMPFDSMVSPNAKERWKRWRQDLDRAEENRKMEECRRYNLSPEPPQYEPGDHDSRRDELSEARKAHTRRLMLQNEGQPISPPPSDDSPAHTVNPSSSRTAPALSMLPNDSSDTEFDPTVECTDPYGPPIDLDSGSKNPFSNSTQKMPTDKSLSYLASHASNDGGLTSSRWADHSDLPFGSEDDTITFVPPDAHSRDGSSDSSKSNSTAVGLSMPSLKTGSKQIRDSADAMEDPTMVPMPETPPEKGQQSPTPHAGTPLSHVKNAPPLPPDETLTTKGRIEEDDVITDTVGAIAIDMHGNIACAASSGGIGMKHRGRIGPAALVNVGACVIPPDYDDLERTTVATVTSGTGEHMGTANAAAVCSDRIYHNLRKVPGGSYEECGDDEAMDGFIKKDFMGHPSVQHSNSSGAIGILSVKKTRDGAWLYFGHNTDSFALASFHSDEAKPVCTMSRNKGNGGVAQGGRAIRFGLRRRQA